MNSNIYLSNAIFCKLIVQFIKFMLQMQAVVFQASVAFSRPKASL